MDAATEVAMISVSDLERADPEFCMAAVWDGRQASFKHTLCSPKVHDNKLHAAGDFLCERDLDARHNRQIGGISLMSMVPRPSLDQSATDLLLVDSLQTIPLSIQNSFEARLCWVAELGAQDEWSSDLIKRCVRAGGDSMQASQGSVLKVILSGTARGFDSLSESFVSDGVYVPA